MDIEHPSSDIQTAVHAAVAWLKSHALHGFRVATTTTPEGDDCVVVQDAAAPAIWARMYSLQTQQPVFCDRDAEIKGSIAELSFERRNGYDWYGSWPAELVERAYAAWMRRVAAA
jgi:PelA/Pel-15E family pectate lyase